MSCVYVHTKVFLFLLYNTFTVTQLTRDKLLLHQSGVWFQYEHRLQVLRQGWTVSLQRQVDLMQSRYRQRPRYSQVSLGREVRRGDMVFRIAREVTTNKGSPCHGFSLTQMSKMEG